MNKVSIITRTKNRPILLPRVLESLENQKYKNFQWVLVNDAGIREPVDQIAELARTKGIDVAVIHREKSVGMEAASNNGIEHAKGDYILIHDDDDSLYPEFLDITTKYLDSNNDQVGVVVQSTMVIEKISEKGVQILHKRPYNNGLLNLCMSDLLMHNQFPPISFLFRKSVYDEVGGFNEDLPVLGDWDFHLRCLLNGNIGVIPMELAYYHHREDKNNSVYSNSVVGSIDKHAHYEAIFRNNLLREDIINNQIGLGVLLTLGRQFQSIHHRFGVVDMLIGKAKAVIIKLRLGRFIK
ncbi:glycosyltransferase [Vibrio viridaestus]|uniref:Glycosyltransferase n=1 Tax=Vibrio viridaestus TaxID=2487322 RepID=A0A3N9TDX5_9VIBR|nr:glycosyltransferase [Vibrio viridaestus]RQW61715.1 glycosyltransferase [Vibrio viridaestus]